MKVIERNYRASLKIHIVGYTHVYIYSRTSMAQTLMARLPVSNSFLSPLEKKSYSCRFGLI